MTFVYVFNFLYKNRTFIATASRIVRPNTIYRLNVVVLPGSPDLILKAVIIQGAGHQIASASEIADAGSSHNLLLKVIFSSVLNQFNVTRIQCRVY